MNNENDDSLFDTDYTKDKAKIKDKDKNKEIIAGNFVLVSQIDKGAFGKIFLSIDIRGKREVAIKIERKSQANNPQLLNESNIYQSILSIAKQSDNTGSLVIPQEDILGIPKFHGYGELAEVNYLILDFLGPNLHSLLPYSKRKNYSIPTVCLIALQMINRVELFHTKGFIHRDIKPENFMIGTKDKTNVVHLIDYGLSRRYLRKDSHQHIPYKEGRSLVGTARYLSIHAHLGIEQSRRDDIESIGYVLLYFLRGNLPWQGMKLQGNTQGNIHQKIMKKKMEIPTEMLCLGQPIEITSYFNYTKQLRFEDRPDYDYLRSLFLNLLSQYLIDHGINRDDLQFDWCCDRNYYHNHIANNKNQTHRGEQKHFSIKKKSNEDDKPKENSVTPKEEDDDDDDEEEEESKKNDAGRQSEENEETSNKIMSQKNKSKSKTVGKKDKKEETSVKLELLGIHKRTKTIVSDNIKEENEDDSIQSSENQSRKCQGNLDDITKEEERRKDAEEDETSEDTIVIENNIVSDKIMNTIDKERIESLCKSNEEDEFEQFLLKILEKSINNNNILALNSSNRDNLSNGKTISDRPSQPAGLNSTITFKQFDSSKIKSPASMSKSPVANCASALTFNCDKNAAIAMNSTPPNTPPPRTTPLISTQTIKDIKPNCTLASKSPKNSPSIPTSTATANKHSLIEQSPPQMKLTKENLITISSEPITDHYTVIKDIGQGSYGQVRLVRSNKLHEIRAMKIVDKSEKGSKTEINILRKISHPNIVNVLQIFNDKTKYYIMTEYIEGGELFDAISSLGFFSECEAAHIIRQILDAVNYIHGLNIVHRDLKPENIMLLSKNNSLKLIDFGTAVQTNPNETLHSFIGSCYYIAPEVINESYNKQCDVWSCGVILYILLCGYPPFFRPTNKELFHAIVTQEIIFDDDNWRNVSSEAIDLITNMLIKDPEKRLNAQQCLNHPWFQSMANKRENQYHKSQNAKNSNNINDQLNILGKMKMFVQENKFKHAVLQFISTQFNLKKEEESLKELFKSFDKNHKGEISKEDFLVNIEKIYGDLLANDIMKDIFSKLDLDGNGNISYNEFLTIMINNEKIITEDKLRKAFDSFDEDGNGKLSVKEIRNVFGGDIESWEKVIKEVDINGDGQVDFEEFKVMMLGYSKQANIDNDDACSNKTSRKEEMDKIFIM